MDDTNIVNKRKQTMNLKQNRRRDLPKNFQENLIAKEFLVETGGIELTDLIDLY